jgi:hypothetical protein
MGQTQIVSGDLFHGSSVHWQADADPADVDPLVEVTVTWGDIVSALRFESKKGVIFGQIGNNKPPGGNVTVFWAPTNEIISSVYINGIDNYYQSANLIIFGFRYLQEATTDPTAFATSVRMLAVADRSD